MSGRIDPYMEHMARWKFARLAIPLRQRARDCGYALLTHGTLAYDIDMVAVPWAEDAVAAEVLVGRLIETVFKHNDGVAFTVEGQIATPKPHGRLGWNIHVGGTYIDLSVTPRATHGSPDPAPEEKP